MSLVLTFHKVMNSELSETENIKLMTDLGIDEVTAKFIYDLETGGVDGDAINEDGIDDNKEIKLGG